MMLGFTAFLNASNNDCCSSKMTFRQLIDHAKLFLFCARDYGQYVNSTLPHELECNETGNFSLDIGPLRLLYPPSWCPAIRPVFPPLGQILCHRNTVSCYSAESLPFQKRLISFHELCQGYSVNWKKFKNPWEREENSLSEQYVLWLFDL
jgi:hypothetical protein